MSKHNDLSEFDKVQLGHYWVRASPELQLSWGVPSLQWSLSIESTNNGHVSIRAGPHGNGTMWSVLMNHIFFYIAWKAGCVYAAYLGNTCHQDTLWRSLYNAATVEIVLVVGGCYREGQSSCCCYCFVH